MSTSYFFIGGCSGGGSPPSGTICFPSARRHMPLVVPITRTEFGGLTSAFGVLCGDIGFFIDNGTGVQHVAEFLEKGGAKFVLGLQTHFHMDHTLGIYSNPLLFRNGIVSQILAPKLSGRSFEELMRDEFRRDVWPVSPMDKGVTIPIREFEMGETLSVFRDTRTIALNHPGGSVGYRFNLPRGDLVIATDHELTKEFEGEYAEFISGAHTLYADIEFRNREYEGTLGICGSNPIARCGWGHSTPHMLGSAISRCDVAPKVVIIGHHNPRRSDEDLRHFEYEVREMFRGMRTSVRFARECDCYEI